MTDRGRTVQVRQAAIGDLYVLAELNATTHGGDHDAESVAGALEWLLLEQPSAERWLVVPADTLPLTGSGDVEVPPQAATGPLGLRCRFAVELPASALRPELYNGTVEGRWVAAARARVQGDASLEAAPLAEETDLDPEYLEWQRGVLRPARAAVEALSRPAPVVALRRASSPQSSGAGASWRARRGELLRLAATAVLAAGLGLWVGLWNGLWNGTDPRPEQAEVNLRLEWLLPGQDEVRGSQRELRFTESAMPGERVTFVLETWRPWDGERYRLELWRQDTSDRAAYWSSDELRLQGASEIRFSLPRAWLPAGRYQLRLFGLETGADAAEIGAIPVALETYDVRIEVGGDE